MIRLIFPEILDLTPYTTSGQLSLIPSVPISSPPPAIPRSTTPTPATYAVTRTIYRLSAVVCHYGQHSFGHYVCFRRKPPEKWNPPRMGKSGEVSGSTGWLRISDDSVRECELDSVLAEGSGAFMLYYERVVLDRPGLHPYGKGSPKSSEETLKPEMVGSSRGYANGSASTSTLSLGSIDGLEIGLAMMEEKKAGSGRGVGPRIVRSVATGRRRSSSAGPAMRRESRSPIEVALNGILVNGNAKGKGKDLENHISPDGEDEPILVRSTPNLGTTPLPRPENLHHRAESPPPPAHHITESPLSSPIRHTEPPPPERIQSPQPIHPPATNMVGLRV
jgi:ubiquitin carboxyl-terminal hydrolase 1